MKHTVDEFGSHYFGADKRVHRTESFPSATVNVDYDEDGKVVGIEVLTREHEHRFSVQPSGYGIGWMNVCKCGHSQHIGYQ
jgi:hypothetical protein